MSDWSFSSNIFQTLSFPNRKSKGAEILRECSLHTRQRNEQATSNYRKFHNFLNQRFSIVLIWSLAIKILPIPLLFRSIDPVVLCIKSIDVEPLISVLWQLFYLLLCYFIISIFYNFLSLSIPIFNQFATFVIDIQLNVMI